jgi:hypothetical protein
MHRDAAQSKQNDIAFMNLGRPFEFLQMLMGVESPRNVESAYFSYLVYVIK